MSLKAEPQKFNLGATVRPFIKQKHHTHSYITIYPTVDYEVTAVMENQVQLDRKPAWWSTALLCGVLMTPGEAEGAFAEAFVEKAPEKAAVTVGLLDSDDILGQTDGGSASYYSKDIPPHILHYIREHQSLEARHVIEMFLDNDFDKGNIFKGLTRLGVKVGVSVDYDINKGHFFLDNLKERYGSY